MKRLQQGCACIALLVIAAYPCRALAQVFITELMWMGSDYAHTDEWIELTNDTEEDADLSAWFFTLQKDEEEIMLRIATGTILKAGSSAVIANNASDESAIAIDPLGISSDVSLPNSKLLLRLYDAGGQLWDEVDDGIGEPFAGENPIGGMERKSMERISLEVSGSEESNWRTATARVNIDEESDIVATPGWFDQSGRATEQHTSAALSAGSSSVSVSSDSSASLDSLASSKFSDSSISIQPSSESNSSILSTNSDQSSSVHIRALFISEIFPNPQGIDDGEWIEIKNNGGTPVSLAGWSLTRGSKVYSFPSDAVITAGDYLIVGKEESGIVLPNTSGTVELRHGEEIVDVLEYNESFEGMSIGKEFADDTPHVWCSPTPGAANANSGLSAEIDIQSGSTRMEAPASINLNLLPQGFTLAAASCQWDYGDGHLSDACNPPSHRFEYSGQYTVTVEVELKCDTTVTQSLSVELTGEESSPPTVAVPTTYSGPVPRVSIVAAMPNPEGSDTAREWIEIKNQQDAPLALAGWMFQVGTKTWTIPTLSLAAGEQKRIRLGSSATIQLKNTDGSVSLLLPDERLVSMLSWQKSRDDEVVRSFLQSEERRQARVLRVIDGDTIEVRLAESSPVLYEGQTRDPFIVRLLGIDTPESVHPDKEVEDGAIEATEFLRSRIDEEMVDLFFDEERQDIYGRMLAYVHHDGADVQELLLRNGFARVSRFDFSRKELYQGVQNDAERLSVGMWSKGEDEFGFEELELKEAEDAKVANVEKEVDKISEEGNNNIMNLTNVTNLINSSLYEGLYITEVVSAPADGPEWIELWNATERDIDLTGLLIDDIADGGSKPWELSDIIVFADSYTVIQLPSKLALNNGGDDVRLLVGEEAIDQVSVPKLKEGQAYGLGAGDWCIQEIPTPNTSSICEQKNSSNNELEPELEVKNDEEISPLLALLKAQAAGTGSLIELRENSSSQSDVVWLLVIIGAATAAGIGYKLGKRGAVQNSNKLV